MSNQAASYEPLTSQNAALVLVDHQVGLMTGVRGGRRLGNIQRDQAASWTPAHATGRCYCVGLRNLDGGDPQG
jgi:hypothetical protein